MSIEESKIGINQNTFLGPSFSKKNRVKRFIWGIVYNLLFRYSPRPFHKWRKFILQLFGAKIGTDTHVYPGVKIWAPWNISIGKQCGIADGVELYSMDKITIGDNTVISQNSFICTGTHDYENKGFRLTTLPVIIGSNVWIAIGVFVHPGVEIQEGCVVGASSVVTKNLTKWNVYSGVPCKFIKERKFRENETYSSNTYQK